MLPKLNLELTIEQEFKLQVYQKQIANLSTEECCKLLLEIITQNMIKDNLIKNLLRSGSNGDIK
ncbi:NblA/ycf18 family protein [Microcoleus sp. B3-D7]